MNETFFTRYNAMHDQAQSQVDRVDGHADDFFDEAKLQNLLIDRKTLTLVRDFVPRGNALTDMADFFSALSDSTRIKIVSALSISSMCVGDLSSVLELNQTTVSHQLKNLRNIGVVRVRRQGKIAFYSLSDQNILDVMLSAVNFL